MKKRGIAPGDGRDARQPQSARALAATGERPSPGTRSRPTSPRMIGELAGQGFRGPFAVADGRVIHNAGGSEAQELAFALGERGRLSARARSGRHRARCRAAHDLFPPRGRRRPVSHHREISRAAQTVGARRAGLRPCARAGLRLRRDRVAHDDAARSLREHAAHDRSRCSRPASAARTRSRCCRSPPALGLPDRFARRIARNTQLILLEESQPREGRRPGGGLGRHRGPDRAALRRRMDAVPGDREGGRRRRRA